MIIKITIGIKIMNLIKLIIRRKIIMMLKDIKEFQMKIKLV